jgi:hypothetical protein
MAVLWEWDMEALAQPAELVVSELVTNAIRASVTTPPVQAAPGMSGGIPSVELRLAADAGQLLVEVSDRDPRPPVPAGVDPDRDGGRGLLLIEAVSKRWGYYYPAGPGPAQGDSASGFAARYLAAPPVLPVRDPAQGKTVWALLSPP